VRLRTLLAGFVLAGAFATGSAQAARTTTVYAVPTTAQFMNHADDRLRGMATNPFNLKAEAVIVNANGKEKGNGPFPGDDILYSFKLYKSAKLDKPAGSAMFTCYYTFAKKATCDSYFELAGGVLLASGPVVFDGTRFVLSVTGGTDKYIGALGAVNAMPAAKNAERLQLQLEGTTR
jgi:hypothetical protein